MTLNKGVRVMTNHIEKRKQTFKVRDKEITILADALIDDNTGNIIFDLKLDNAAIGLAFDKYRKENNIISTEEIVNFRKKYKLSQRSLAKLLDVGSATVARYESGSLPSESINNLLKGLINNNSYFITLFNQNKYKLTDNDRKKVESGLKGMSSKLRIESVLNAYLFRNNNDKENIGDGFNKFDFEKFQNMVIFFIQKNPKISKTRLNKLLFYSDFNFFKENTISISGTTYIHDHYGPVPSDFELLYTVLKDTGTIDTEPFSDGHGEMFLTHKNFDESPFKNNELKILNEIADKFSNYNAKMITDYSHKEKAYKETKSKEVIPYNYALELN